MRQGQGAPAYHRGMDDVIARLKAAAPGVLADEPVAVAYLFGSHARGEARPDSDVDVALLVPGVSASQRFDLQLRVWSHLSTAADVPELDVIVLEDVPLRLAGQVVVDGVVIYSVDESMRAEYESRTFRESVDFSVLGDPLDREMIRLTAQGKR